MHSAAPFTLLTSLLAATAYALPAAPAIPEGGFRAQAVRRDEPQALERRSDEGSVQAIGNGGGWIMPVLIGGQQVTLNLDTGSSDFWTTSTLMAPQQRALVKIKSGVAAYDPSRSKTYQKTGLTYGLTYADNSHSKGFGAVDTVNIGGATVMNMPFGVCNDLAVGTGQKDRDTGGCLGLGFGSQNSMRPTPQPTFMEALMPFVKEPVFTTTFRKDASGFVDFGFVDRNLYTGELTTIAIKNNTDGLVGQWGTDGVTFGIGGRPFDLPAIQLDFDSGSSTLQLPGNVASAYFAQVKGASKDASSWWNFDCDAKMPNLDFIFATATAGPRTVTVPGSLIKWGDATAGRCASIIQVVTGRGNAGIPFYQSKFMIWNQKVPSLSFADQKAGAH